jgi:hypothetical protein
MKTKWVSGPVKNTAWVPGPVQLSRPKKSHMKTLWALWGVSAALLVVWLVGISFGLGGWIHAFIGGAIVMAAVCLAYGFKYSEYFERPFIKRVRKRLGGSRSVQPIADETATHHRPAPQK